VSQRQKLASERADARSWFSALSDDQKWELGDTLVLGTFEFTRWGFERPVSDLFLRTLNAERIRWEQDLEDDAVARRSLDNPVDKAKRWI